MKTEHWLLSIFLQNMKKGLSLPEQPFTYFSLTTDNSQQTTDPQLIVHTSVPLSSLSRSAGLRDLASSICAAIASS